LNCIGATPRSRTSSGFFRGQDYGARGLFALDAAAKSGIAREDQSGIGHSRCRACDADPSVGFDGTFGQSAPKRQREGPLECGTSNVVAEQILLEGPKSNLRGDSIESAETRVRRNYADSMGVQAADLLACTALFIRTWPRV